MEQFSPTLYYAPLPIGQAIRSSVRRPQFVTAARQAQHDTLLVIVPPALV